MRKLIFSDAWDRSMSFSVRLPKLWFCGKPATRMLSKRSSPMELGRRRFTEPSGLTTEVILPVS
ncbi:hypothetical protein D3C81_2338120 [compost metagenome]